MLSARFPLPLASPVAPIEMRHNFSCLRQDGLAVFQHWDIVLAGGIKHLLPRLTEVGYDDILIGEIQGVQFVTNHGTFRAPGYMIERESHYMSLELIRFEK
jgi:hypothetical protein